MRIPAIRGVIDRRILANYRIAPDVVAPILPPPFRPKLHRGYAIGGICLIRLRSVRPKLLPAWLGIGSENAAHRFAVEWDEGGATREGVYIPRRDTSSWLNHLAGGRIFPGVHHHAAFTVRETGTRVEVQARGDDGATNVGIVADVAGELPGESIFGSTAEASAFFERGALGYSATGQPGRFQGLELKCDGWRVEPLEVRSVTSSFFGDRARFPAGSVAFDCALLMRGIDHEWHGKADLCCPAGPLAKCS
ncbi:DUF2071 domain-containing protein [Limnoglobus roseus]|uniref:Uncharacterized protein n=1 Tax=Limnoglobus roseus TaxID=2598579 RepID=A0A5C1AF33_9BACT|nr:DUF2071 domain-containing protein [Limnoglobus roseus]QEL15608.1 hypothetical protein PX52LOC_02541 [Limnoglobus roseus]